jgi:hypothetical protein
MKTGEIKKEDVNRIQLDKDGKDVLHFWSTNERLQGPVGKVFRASENLKDIGVPLPQDPGGIRPLPDGSYIMLIGSAKETTKSTPEKPSVYSDVYEVCVGGRKYQIDGGLDAFKAKLSGVAVQQAAANVLQSGPALSHKRLYEISRVILDMQYGQDIGSMSPDVLSAHVTHSDNYDEIQYWMRALMGNKKDEAVSTLVRLFPSGYEMHEFALEFLSPLESIKADGIRRKIRALAIKTYVGAIHEENSHEEALAVMRETVNPYAKKEGVTL